VASGFALKKGHNSTHWRRFYNSSFYFLLCAVAASLLVSQTMFRVFPVLLSLAVAAFLLATNGVADTITLKSGEKIEGKVLSETDAELTIEVVSGGVVDERKVPKADVASVSKMKEDEIVWQQLAGIKLGDNSFPSAEQYDAYLKPLHAFLAKYPEATNRSDAEKLVGELEEEKHRVTAGEVKLNSAWLSKDYVQRESYQVGGSIAANFVKAQAARGDLIGAMNAFVALEKQFDGSRGYLEAVVFVRQQVLPNLLTQATQRIAAIPAEKAERDRGVKANVGAERAALQQEIDNEKKVAETALAEAKKAGLKWPPFLRRSDPAMKEIVKLCTETENKLKSLDLVKAGESIKLAEEARLDLEKKDLAAAEKKLKQAQPLWPKNEITKRLTAEVTALIAAEKAAAAEAKATPTPTPKPAAKKSTPIPVTAIGSDAGSDEKPSNPLFPIVAAAILAILAFVGWTAYKKVVKKSNEIIE